MSTIVTKSDISQALDKVLAALFTAPEFVSEVLRRASISDFDAADSWANGFAVRDAGLIVYAIDKIQRRKPKTVANRAAFLEELRRLRRVTPATIVACLEKTTEATFIKKGYSGAPTADVIGAIREFLSGLKKPAPTTSLGEACDRISAAAAVEGDDDAFDLSIWRRELYRERYHGVALAEIEADEPDCFAGMSMATLAAAERTDIDYLVQDLAVRGQAMLTLAHEKTLKSTITMDLLVSLATGKPFLNYFAVPKRQNVLYLSGENGEDASLEVFRRVCDAKGVEANEVEGFTFATWLPKFYKPEDLDELRRRTKAAGAGFVAADPAGMCTSPGAATVVSIAYDELRAVTEAVKSCGATFAAVHHATKQSNVTRTGLRSAAGAGFAEWARQWLLLDCVGQFKPETGEHRIRMVAGGSRGHSGRWTLDVREGNVADADGRVWDVKVTQFGEKVQALSDEKVSDDAAKVLAAMRSIGEAATARAIRTKASNMNAAVFAAAVAHLLDGNAVKSKTVPVKGIDRDGYELCGSDSVAGAA
jgi:hypothetical protein